MRLVPVLVALAALMALPALPAGAPALEERNEAALAQRLAAEGLALDAETVRGLASLAAGVGMDLGAGTSHHVGAPGLHVDPHWVFALSAGPMALTPAPSPFCSATTLYSASVPFAATGGSGIHWALLGSAAAHPSFTFAGTGCAASYAGISFLFGHGAFVHG